MASYYAESDDLARGLLTDTGVYVIVPEEHDLDDENVRRWMSMDAVKQMMKKEEGQTKALDLRHNPKLTKGLLPALVEYFLRGKPDHHVVLGLTQINFVALDQSTHNMLVDHMRESKRTSPPFVVSRSDVHLEGRLGKIENSLEDLKDDSKDLKERMDRLEKVVLQLVDRLEKIEIALTSA